MSPFVKKLAEKLDGNSEVSCFQYGVTSCKTFIHRFDSDPRLQFTQALTLLFSSRTSAILPVFPHDLRAASPARKIASKGEALAKLRPEVGRRLGRTFPKSWTVALLPLLLTGCNSDRTVPIEAVWLPLGLCIILIGFLFYVLEQHGRSVKLIRKLQVESIRGTCSRIGTIDLDYEEGTASLDGWSFQGGFTGFVVHGYRISELEAMQSAEIERVAKLAVSEVGR